MEERSEIRGLQEKFPESYVRTEEFRGDLTVVVRKDRIIDILRFLKDDSGFLYNYLTDITCVDYLKIKEEEK